jgi:hypothetical protein
MNLASVKEKLHEYIEQADEKRCRLFNTLLEAEIEDRSSLYDDATLQSFQQTSEGYSSGVIKGYPVEESMKRIRKQIAV